MLTVIVKLRNISLKLKKSQNINYLYFFRGVLKIIFSYFLVINQVVYKKDIEMKKLLSSTI